MAVLTTAEKLVEAERAYHDLMIGKSAKVFVDQNGERVEFTSANAAYLRQYIDQLKAEIAGTPAPNAPLTVYF